MKTLKLNFFTRKDYSEEWEIPYFNKTVSENIEPELDKRISEMQPEDQESVKREKKLIENFLNKK